MRIGPRVTNIRPAAPRELRSPICQGRRLTEVDPSKTNILKRERSQAVSYQALIAKLERTTSGRKLIPEIDGLRFLAIAMVVLYHARGNYLKRLGATAEHESVRDSGLVDLFGEGHLGVQLFFAISGFILVLPFARHYLGQGSAPSIRKYFTRRVTRLEPPYLVALLVYFAVRFAGSPDIGLVEHLLASVFYLHGSIYHEPSVLTVVAWSLEIEVQFYLLAPLLARVFAIPSTGGRRLVTGLAILACSWQADLRGAGVGPGLFIIDFFQYFLVGFLVADLYLKGDLESSTLRRSGDIALLAGLVGIGLSSRLADFVGIVVPFCVLLIMVGGMSGQLGRRLFQVRTLVVIGGACYSVYLYHMLFLAAASPVIAKIAQPLPAAIGQPAYILLLAVAATLPCLIPFALIEKPTMNPKWIGDLFARVKRFRASGSPRADRPRRRAVRFPIVDPARRSEQSAADGSLVDHDPGRPLL